MMTDDDHDHDDDLGRAVGALAAGDHASGDQDHQSLRRILGLVRSSMRAAGARSVGTGRWLGETALDVATHIPARDLTTLRAHHDGRSGRDLADALIRNASHATAAVGAVAGAVAGAEELAPPAWVTLPAGLVVETLAVVALEMKLVAELHAVYGRPVTGSPTDRGVAIARAWAERRGVSANTLVQAGGLARSLGHPTRRELTRLLQRRLARRTLRNLPTLAPFLAGAVAGAEVNRRATRALGLAVTRDLDAGGGTGTGAEATAITVRTVPPSIEPGDQGGPAGPLRYARPGRTDGRPAGTDR